MRPITSTILLTLILTLCFSEGAAQQSGARKAPLLTSEDLKAVGEASASISPGPKSITRDSAKWQRYSPNELGLSIDLPGKPMLMGLTFPDFPQQLGPAKAYTYQNEQISAFVLRFTIKKLPVSVRELRNFGAGFLDASARKPGVTDVDNQTEQADDSTVLLLSTYAQGTLLFETRGFVHTNGKDVWLIVTRFSK